MYTAPVLRERIRMVNKHKVYIRYCRFLIKLLHIML